MAAFTVFSMTQNDPAQLAERWATSEDFAQSRLKKTPERQQEYLTGRACLRGLLKAVTGESDWQITLDAKAKPHVITANGDAGPHISISHTQGLIACAVSTDAAIGIDVEFHRPRDYGALAGYAFGLLEQKVIREEGAEVFYRIWTLKEAMAKALGTGIFSMLGKDDRFNEVIENTPWAKDGWQFLHTRPTKNHTLSVAIHILNVSGMQKIKRIDLNSL